MSNREEEIFNKEVEKVVSKPKRKLSEKQLANLALGRERMRLKREIAKKQKEEKAQVKTVKDSDKTAKKNQTVDRKKQKEKRRTLKEINSDKAEAILAKLEKQEAETNTKRTNREDLYYSLKVKCLEKATTVKEYNEIKEHLDGIDEDTLHNDDKLKKYAINVMKPYISKKELTEVKNL